MTSQLLTRDEVLRDANRQIWRYITVERLNDLLKTSELHFARIDQFNDHHEAAISRPAFERNIAEAYARMDAEGWTETAEQRRFAALNREAAAVLWNRMGVYACCWHKSENESSLMWANYGDRGVAVQSTIGRLDAATPPPPTGPLIHIQPVIYVDHDNDDMDYTESFIHKHRIYQDEHEVRAFLFTRGINVENYRPSQNPKYQRISCDLNTLVEAIHLAPRSQEYEEVRAMLDEAGLQHVPIIRSAADTVPEYRVELEEFIQQRIIDETF